MEKFVLPTVSKDWELFLKSHPDSKTAKKGFFVKTLEHLNQWLGKWESPIPVSEKAQSETSTLVNESLAERINVPAEVIHTLMDALKDFESEKGYLDRELDLPKLAKTLGTNHSYLSRVVNHVKGKPFKKYLNDMRIEHAFIELQTNPKKRLFTVEAIAFENGFRSAESFSKKFKERYSYYPSEFLKRLAAFDTL